jgi:hypothetical protein
MSGGIDMALPPSADRAGHEPSPTSGLGRAVAIPSADGWHLADKPPADDVTVIAVADSHAVCNWWFAAYSAGDYWDRSTGGMIYPTHWTELPRGPSGGIA